VNVNEIDIGFRRGLIIAFLKGDTKILEKLSGQRELFVSCISVGEMCYGANNSLQKDKNRLLYDSFF